MTYYGSVGNNNLCLRGETSTSQNQINADGAYSGMFVQCSGWSTVNNTGQNFSHEDWFNCGVDPRLNTGQDGNSYNFGTGYRNKDRLFHVTMQKDPDQSGTMFFSSPFSTSTSNEFLYAYKNSSMSNTQTSITTRVTAGYGGFFVGYYANSALGTFLTSTATVNWFYNGTYADASFAYLKILYCSIFGL